jgi:hypothetical protein
MNATGGICGAASVRRFAKPRSKETLRVRYQIEGMQPARASFVRSGAPCFTYGQQTLIEQKSSTVCALEINAGPAAPAKIRPYQHLV